MSGSKAGLLSPSGINSFPLGIGVATPREKVGSSVNTFVAGRTAVGYGIYALLPPLRMKFLTRRPMSPGLPTRSPQS